MPSNTTSTGLRPVVTLRPPPKAAKTEGVEVYYRASPKEKFVMEKTCVRNYPLTRASGHS